MWLTTLVVATLIVTSYLFIDRSSDPIKILSKNPLIDGHNDLLILLRFAYPDIYDSSFNFEEKLLGQVDKPRIDAGHYSGAFWSAFVPCPSNVSDFSDAAYAPYVKATLEQIDLFNRLSLRYPKYFTLTRRAGDVTRKRLTSPLAIEGLHQIGNSLATLRLYYELGVRYATLTWNCHNKYADAALLTEGNKTYMAPALYHGLSTAGKELVLEMNRMGMIVDISHTSVETMKDVLAGGMEDELTKEEHMEQPQQRFRYQQEARQQRLSQQAESDTELVHKWRGSIAPPIFSHSSVYAICPHPRNVPDDVLSLVVKRKSVVMINFSPDFISCEFDGEADTGLPRFVNETNTIDQVVKHIVYIGENYGWDYVGIGTDFDGIFSTPRGMEDVSKFPALVQKLLDHGVSKEDVTKVIGGNIIRVWKEVERVAERLQKTMHPVLDKQIKEEL